MATKTQEQTVENEQVKAGPGIVGGVAATIIEIKPPPGAIMHDPKRGTVDQTVRLPYAVSAGSLVQTWRSYAALQAALPAGVTPIEQDENGDWYRKVPYHTGPGGTKEHDGVLYFERKWENRYVALSLVEAQERSRPGREVDFWNGFTWIRRGLKPELDAIVMTTVPRDDDTAEYEVAPEADQALRRVELARRASHQAPLQAMPPSAAVAAGKD